MKKRNVRREKFIAIFTFLFFTHLSFGQGKVGETAPEIHYDLSFPIAYNLPVKKALFIDFWATWCSPCIEGIKETNEWVTEYHNQIELICITNNTSKNVDGFIKAGNFKHIFLVDTTNQTFDEFVIESLPTAFLIDSNGIIIWRGHSKGMTKSILDEFLYTGKVLYKNKSSTVSMNITLENTFKKTEQDQVEGPSFTIMGAKGDSIKYFIKNKSLEEIIELLYNIPQLVIFNGEGFKTHYDLQVSRKNIDINTINLDIIEEISKIVPFSYNIEKRDTCITELVVLNEDLLFSNKAQYDSISGVTNDHLIDFEFSPENIELFTGKNISLQELAFELAKFYKRPFVTNTTIQDRFNFEQIPLFDYDQFCDLLMQKYGLELKIAISTLPFLIVD
jgi:thiol-disulfide isomerase/thioredoxin